MQAGSFWEKQGRYLLQSRKYAWLMTAILALLPLMSWLSLTVMALVTLRKGKLAGFKCLIIGVTVSICCAEVLGNSIVESPIILSTYLLCFICAVLLRATISWQIVAGFIVFLGLTALLLVHWLAPHYAISQYHALMHMLQALDPSGELKELLGKQSLANQLSMANYLLGIKALSLIVSALFSLMAARSIQASIFNPGGFKQEMLAFRANQVVLLLFVACAAGAYQANSICLSWLPLLFIYLMAAGVSLSLHLLKKKKRLATFVLLLAPVVLIPYIMLPVYVLFGSIDSLFNLRSRLFLLTSENQNKG